MHIPSRGSGARRGALLVALSLSTGIGCGQNQTEELSQVEDDSTAAQSDSGASEELDPATAMAYSNAYNDIYANMTTAQRALLAPGLSEAELASLTPDQLAALSLMKQSKNADRAQVVNNELATKVNTALGQLNMEEVSEALEEAEDIEDFEAKVNRIYEGPHVLLVQARNQGDQMVTQVWEDLNDTGAIDESVDDKAFDFVVERQSHAAELIGRGANSYYSREFPANYPEWGGFFQDFIVDHLPQVDFTYQTPPARRATITKVVRSHRSSPAWEAQRRATREYYQRMWRQNPQYVKALIGISQARRDWRSKRRVSIPLPPPPPQLKIRIPRSVRTHHRTAGAHRAAPPPPPSKVVRPGAPPPPPSKVVRPGAPPPPPSKVVGPPGHHPGKGIGHAKGRNPAKAPHPGKGIGHAKGRNPAKAPHPAKGRPSPPGKRRAAPPPAPSKGRSSKTPSRSKAPRAVKAPPAKGRAAPPPPPSKRR